jgi:predicted DNA-binding ribbon-helix-helix protein
VTVKRSLSIAGHRTSLSLEPEFWIALNAIAARQKKPIAQLVRDIDSRRGQRNLSSAVRVYILETHRP